MELMKLGILMSTIVLIIIWSLTYKVVLKNDSSEFIMSFILTIIYLIGWMITILEFNTI